MSMRDVFELAAQIGQKLAEHCDAKDGLPHLSPEEKERKKKEMELAPNDQGPYGKMVGTTNA